MSVVNKMLQDLEARQEPRPVPPAYQGLRAVRGARRRRRLLFALAGLLALVLGAFIYGERLGLRGDSLIALALSGLHDRPEAVPASGAVTARAEGPASPVVAQDSAGTGAEAPAFPAVAPGSAAPAAVPVAPAPAPPAVAEAVPAERVEPLADSPGPRAAAIVAAKARKTPAPSARATHDSEPDPRAATGSRNAGGRKAPAAIEKTAQPLTAAEQAQADYLRGVRRFEQGRAPQAMESLRAALAADPTHVKARELAAAIALQQGRRHEAQGLLEEGLRQVPKQHLFARMLARVYIDQGAEAKALALLEGAAPGESDDADYSALLGLLYQRAGRHADAVKAYERALSHGDNGRLWLGLAISLEGTEQQAAAKEAYRRARERGLDPMLARYAEQRLAALD